MRCAAGPRGNVLLSPTSAAEALSLLYPAGGGQTAEPFRAVLHLPEWSPDLVAAARNHTPALDRLRYDGDLEDDAAPDSLQMSNHLWTALDLKPDPGYLDGIATAFDANVRALDFAGDRAGATDRINTTVDEEPTGSSRSSSTSRWMQGRSPTAGDGRVAARASGQPSGRAPSSRPTVTTRPER